MSGLVRQLVKRRCLVGPDSLVMVQIMRYLGMIWLWEEKGRGQKE